jgi:hypothetical protein
MSLLSYRFFHPLPSEPAAAIQTIKDENPELNAVLSDGSSGFFLVALAGCP